MAGQQIAQYFAKVGILVDNKEFAKVDKALRDVEKQLTGIVGGSTKEVKAKKEATTATEKKVKAVEKETKATKDLNKEQEKQNKDIARRLKQQQALLKKSDAEAIKQANTFLALQKKLASANPSLKALSQRQITANRAAFFSGARASDLKTGQGLQYRLGAQQRLTAIRKPTIVMPVSSSGRLSRVDLTGRLSHLDQDIGASREMQKMSDYYRRMEREASRSAEKIAKDRVKFSEQANRDIEAGLRRLEKSHSVRLSEVDKALARMRARGIGGVPPSGGGSAGGYYKERHTSPLYLHKDRMHLFGGTALGFAPGGAGLAAAGLGLAAGGAFMTGQQINQLRRDQTSVEMQRTQLDVASGYTSRPFQSAQNKNFFDLANQTGSAAGNLITSYAQMMKTLIAQGQQAEGAFDLYKNMTLFAKGSGANDMQIERAAYAVGQVYGKGYLSREEWALQLADALPGLRKFLMQVTGEQLGVKTGEDLDKALKKKSITPDMLVEAFRRAGQYALPMVETYASTAQAAENRLANQKLQEQMARTLDDEVIPAAKRLTEAQANLYEATMPLRDAFYSLSASALSTTAEIFNFGSELANKYLPSGSGAREFAKDSLPLLAPLSAIGPTGWAAQMGMLLKNYITDDTEPLSSMTNNLATNRALDRLGMGTNVSGNTFTFNINLEGGTEGLQDFITYGLEKEVTKSLQFFGNSQ